MLICSGLLWKYLCWIFQEDISKIQVFGWYGDFFGQQLGYLGFSSWVNCYFWSQAQKTNRYYKSLNIFIPHRFGKLFFINKLYFLGDGQSFSCGISFLGKIFLGKLGISVTKDKKEHAKNHFNADLCK